MKTRLTMRKHVVYIRNTIAVARITISCISTTI